MLELNRMVSYLKNHAEEFAELLAQKTTKDYERESRNRQQHLQELMARNKEVDRLFERIYEDNVKGRISDEHFSMLSRTYEDEQTELRTEMGTLQQEIEAQVKNEVDLESFIEKVRKYSDLQEPTPYTLQELVSAICVEAPVELDGKRHQNIRV